MVSSQLFWFEQMSTSGIHECFFASRIREVGQRENSERPIAALQLLKERDQAEDRLEGLLREADESGEPTEMTQQDWDDIRREVREHSQKRKLG